MANDSPMRRLLERVAYRHKITLPGHLVNVDEFIAWCSTCQIPIGTTTDGPHPEFTTFWSQDMKITHENGWDVTSPIYVGSSRELEAASRCSHAEYREVLRASQDGFDLIQEQCKNCIAVRVKTRPQTGNQVGPAHPEAR